MLSRPLVKRIGSAGAVALVLLATLPEVFCCCDISWGPGGLLSSLASCQQTAEAAGACCCCHSAQQCGTEISPLGSGSEKECHGQCPCTLTCVSPPPMNGSEVVDIDSALACVRVETAATAPLAIAGPLEPPGRIRGQTRLLLTPSARCALLQTWRI